MFNQTQEIKRQFFAMRNGVIADTIRKGGLEYKMVFGLNLPQVKEIAESLPHTPELAEQMWEDSRTRESMLLAPMLYPVDQFSREVASRWIKQIPTTEVGDILCHSLIRKHPHAWEIAMEFVDSDVEMERYTAFRLLFNLLYIRPDDILPLVKREYEKNSPITRQMCQSMISEIESLKDD